MLKKALRIFLRSFLVFTGVIALYFLCAWSFCRITVNNDFTAAKNGVKIFVRTNGVHCDVIVPAHHGAVNWFAELPPSDFEMVDTTFSYAAFGWGDKGFYINTPNWSDLKFSTAFNALFWMSSTAMHVNWWKHSPQENADCRSIIISEGSYTKLTAYIHAGFLSDASGKFQLIDHAGYTSYDRFYEAIGTYSLFNTCNVWSGNALSAAGIKVGYWTPFDRGLMNSLK
jgi:uncharacterized protein (TIGR02117 family)